MIKGPVKQHPMCPDWVIDAEGATVCKARAPEEAAEIVPALNSQAEQAKRIKELEWACEVVICNIDADAVTAGWASDFLKKWLGKEAQDGQ